MAKKDKTSTKKKYRLVIFEEVSLKERVNFTLSKGNIFTYGGTIIILIGFLVSLLFIFTPLKYFLPPVDNYKLESKIIRNTVIVDSLKKEIAFRDNYFNQIKNIINGVDISQYAYSDTSMMSSLLTEQQKDSILEELIKRDQENLEDIRQNDIVDIDNANFYKPLSGVVSNDFKPANGHNGIDIVAPENDPVVATLSGTVVLATWSLNTGYVIQIQHANNIISVYKHNGELLKKEGDRVNAGEPIALVGNTGEHTTGPHLHFEIWQNGSPVNPTNFISF
ncbi:MAG: M23 family metallopeptidase [Bacteroidales bacterium]|nr:M23 family metallopeptidase [Bacteroidales bacterium]